ncbi:unnamed protein product [Pleuronectes platessa]|uniref:Uncharacterized protein n=1 Tax=Pleuronectes platessa TaxID=8262 RepID=A0A9N7VP40_PLEPL|nr:unnamed protein product [Pleuronectes platessa]
MLRPPCITPADPLGVADPLLKTTVLEELTVALSEQVGGFGAPGPVRSLGSIIICHLGRGPPPLSQSNAKKGSLIPSTISWHDIESTTLDPPMPPPMLWPWICGR